MMSGMKTTFDIDQKEKLKEKATEELLSELEIILDDEQKNVDEIIRELNSLPICKRVSELQKSQNGKFCPFGYIKPQVRKK